MFAQRARNARTGCGPTHRPHRVSRCEFPSRNWLKGQTCHLIPAQHTHREGSHRHGGVTSPGPEGIPGSRHSVGRQQLPGLPLPCSCTTAAFPGAMGGRGGLLVRAQFPHQPSLWRVSPRSCPRMPQTHRLQQCWDRAFYPPCQRAPLAKMLCV